MPEIRYTKDHEYARLEGDEAVVGISDHAQAQLGDVVFAEVPAIGKIVKAGEATAVIESVKAASDVYTPLSGEVIAVNSAVEAQPGVINEEPLGKGWLFRIKLSNAAEFATLMDEAAYEAFLKAEG
jgi:glycine cleavage system H protein